jgi:hypothetical protein
MSGDRIQPDAFAVTRTATPAVPSWQESWATVQDDKAPEEGRTCGTREWRAIDRDRPQLQRQRGDDFETEGAIDVNPSPTLSEALFERWCHDHGIVCRRIREAYAQGHKRPDYAIKALEHWCIVEIKQLDQTRDDKALLQELSTGAPPARWVNPGARLRQSIKDASSQLRKYSRRRFPTVVCFFDATIGFYLERFQVEQTMFGQKTLRFAVSSDPNHEPRFLGERSGKKATLTPASNRSISAVAVLRQPTGSGLIIDLHHNPHARVSIPHELSTPYVRKQYADGIEDPDRAEPTILDLMESAEWQEWLDDPEGKCDREVEKCLQEIRAGKIQ